MRLCPACAARLPATEWRCAACGSAPPMLNGFRALAPQLADTDTGMRPESYAQLAPREAGHAWFTSRNRLLTWALDRYFPDAASLFEIGCGTGFVLSAIAERRPRLRLGASDLHPRGLAIARDRLGAGPELIQLDARHLPFADEFDVVCAFDVLEHIEDDEAVLEAAHRAVRPGGGVLLTVPQHRFLWSRFDEDARHVRRYAARELQAKVARAGFEVVRSTSFVTLPFPAMVLARRSRRRPAPPGGGAQMNPPRWANAVLATGLGLERAAIRAGLDLPFGGSRLVVARKHG